MNNIEKAINYISNLENKVYFEMSKGEIISSLSSVLLSVKKWQKSFNANDFYHIQEEYKEIESVISELELCLADYDNIVHCSGISYALYQIGNILIEILKEKESSNDGR